MIVRFCPQCGQNVMARPSGSAPSHERQRSPAFGMIEPVPGAVIAPDARAMLAIAGGVAGVAIIGGTGPGCSTEIRGAGAVVAASDFATGALAVTGALARAGCSDVVVANGMATSGPPESSAGPASRLRSADGDSAT